MRVSPVRFWPGPPSHSSLPTGGTALASVELLRQAGAVVEHALFVIDLPDLAGADRLRGAGVDVATLMEFEGD